MMAFDKWLLLLIFLINNYKMVYYKLYIFVSAKFLKLEQLDQDPGFPSDTAGVSIDGTGQVGTYFYTAPEIEQGWPKIDEKVNVVLLL